MTTAEGEIVFLVYEASAQTPWREHVQEAVKLLSEQQL